jgi:hypothetical protein
VACSCSATDCIRIGIRWRVWWFGLCDFGAGGYEAAEEWVGLEWLDLNSGVELQPRKKGGWGSRLSRRRFGPMWATRLAGLIIHIFFCPTDPF